MHFCSRLLIAIVGFLLLSGPAQRPLPAKVYSLKIQKSQHLAIYYTGEFNRFAEPLVQKAELFLERLEKRWSIILPQEQIKITLFRDPSPRAFWRSYDGSDRLLTRFNKPFQRIELRISDPKELDLEKLGQALNLQLIRYLLNLEKDLRLPPLFEEGLAQYYGRSARGRDRYLAILTFNQEMDVSAFLTDKDTYSSRDRLPYGLATARLFFIWLWSTYPTAEHFFLQHYLSGKPIENALNYAGLSDLPTLLAEFEESERPKHKLGDILYTFDLWVIVFGTLVLLAMLLKVINALRISTMRFTKIEVLHRSELDLEIEAELTALPAFGGKAITQPFSANPVPHSRKISSLTKRTRPETMNREIDDDVDSAFQDFFGEAKTGGSHEASSKGRSTRPAKEGITPPPPPEVSSTKSPAGLGGFHVTVDDDLDELFGEWTTTDDSRQENGKE